jgi:hypothetical protein
LLEKLCRPACFGRKSVHVKTKEGGWINKKKSPSFEGAKLNGEYRL